MLRGPRQIECRQTDLCPVPNTVDLETGAWSNDAGTATLTAEWRDPEFDPAVTAFITCVSLKCLRRDTHYSTS